MQNVDILVANPERYYVGALLCRQDQLVAVPRYRRGWSKVLQQIDDEYRELLGVATDHRPLQAYIQLVQGDASLLQEYVRDVAAEHRLTMDMQLPNGAQSERCGDFVARRRMYVPPREYTASAWILSSLGSGGQ